MTTGKFMMERKEDMKKMHGFSPDLADAIALTFALPVRSREIRDRRPYQIRGKQNKPYHPLERMKYTR
jgi:hypothetical protein